MQYPFFVLVFPSRDHKHNVSCVCVMLVTCLSVSLTVLLVTIDLPFLYVLVL